MRLKFAFASCATLLVAAAVSGCGPENINLADAPALKSAPPATEKLPVKQGGPLAGSSAGINSNPGASR